MRSREKNLTITGLGFITNSDGVIFDDPDTPPSTRDRLRGFRLKADADYADPLRGINQFNVTLSQGIDGFESTNNGNPLASRANGRVDFTKLEFTYARLQPLFWNLSAYGSLYGQYAFDPLLSPELCSYGGRFYGRAYEASALVGDRCWLALGELRLDLPVPSSLLSLAQLYGIPLCMLIALRAQAGTLDSIDAGSAGAGIRFGWNNQLFADLAVAKAIDGPIDDTRFRFTVSARN